MQSLFIKVEFKFLIFPTISSLLYPLSLTIFIEFFIPSEVSIAVTVKIPSESKEKISSKVTSRTFFGGRLTNLNFPNK